MENSPAIDFAARARASRSDFEASRSMAELDREASQLPTITPVRVRSPANAPCRAMPKSSSTGRLPSTTSTLPGLMSRWSRPASCAL